MLESFSRSQEVYCAGLNSESECGFTSSPSENNTISIFGDDDNTSVKSGPVKVEGLENEMIIDICSSTLSFQFCVSKLRVCWMCNLFWELI